MLMAQRNNKRRTDNKFKPPPTRSDQREDARIVSRVPVVIAPFSTRFYREYASMTFNHSKAGMCLEAAEQLKPGSVLYIRLAKSTPDEIYHSDRKNLRISTLAEVKWCREFKDKFGTYYLVGVKYY
jgi:hypothetical protein